MEFIKEKDNVKYIDKYICLLKNINTIEDITISEELDYDIKLEKVLCKVTDDVNMMKYRKELLEYSRYKIFTDEDLFLMSLNKTKTLYLYKKGENGFSIDNMAVMGKEILITEDMICSTNFIKPELVKQECNFSYLKDYVLYGVTSIKTEYGVFYVEYEDNNFIIKFESAYIMQINNVGKKLTYPFVIFLLKNIKLKNQVIEDFEVKIGELV